ncbi:acyl-ACP desaturase [Gordonia crocea]|uniref:Putative acyl-[acyl-carrier protein] desaturase n=1 Tax=Gordonia crocea TaxID=589162 RepID=A0A7I9UVJ7_9ACTN|nr:acyl-ACP desaturase [Gordonia crocea]GED97198.1 putative acyl-[acyl-carrier protein] desaturase [Gordonia crocea]
MSILDTDELVIALEKALPELSEEHQADATPWQPHDWVPWDLGKNYAFLGGKDWEPSDSNTPDEVRAALVALLLLKDNLPSYHRLLAMYFPAFSDWRQLVGVWTAEDNRHAIVLRDYLVVTRAVDPVEAENRRRIHVVAGYRQTEESVADLRPLSVLALLAVHELQTAGFTAKLRGVVTDDVLAQILAKIEADDASQARYFVGFLGAGLVADQDATVTAIDWALNHIDTIGADVEDFDEQRKLFAHYEDDSTRGAIAKAIVDQLKLESVEGLSPEAQAGKERILALAAQA